MHTTHATPARRRFEETRAAGAPLRSDTPPLLSPSLLAPRSYSPFFSFFLKPNGSTGTMLKFGMSDAPPLGNPSPSLPGFTSFGSIPLRLWLSLVMARRAAKPANVQDDLKEAEVPEEDFEAATSFVGAKEGWCFKTGPLGLGYYRDARS